MASRGAAQAATAPVGTFAAARIDQEALPVTDRVVDDDGTLYLIEFDRLLISLTANQTFRASVRYRRTLQIDDPRGQRTAPLQSMSVTGTYALVGDSIRFTPDSASGTGSVRMLTGSVRSSRELLVPFHYRNGAQLRERTLVMQRRDNIIF